MDESTAVIKRNDGHMSTRGVVFRNMDDICRFADLICKSSFVPQSMQGKAGDVVAAIAYGLELGLTPMAALQNIAVINGKPSVFGDMQLALVLNDPECEFVHEREPEEVKDKQAGCCIAKRKGHDAVIRTFSMDDAKKAGLLGKAGPWMSYPHRMLQMRARSWALRDAFPHTLKGLYAREEAQDIELIDVTPVGMTEEPKERRPSKEDIQSLSSLARSCDEIQSDQQKLNPDYTYTPSAEYICGVLGIASGTKLTQKLLREQMTMAQYTEVQGYFDGLIKMLVESEEDVQDFSGTPQTPQDATEADPIPEAEVTDDRATTASADGQNGDVDDDPETPVWLRSSSALDMLKVMDGSGSVRPEALDWLDQRAKHFGTSTIVTAIRDRYHTMTLRQFHDAWDVAKSQRKVKV